MSIESFNLLLLVMGLVALVVFIALYFVRAGYVSQPFLGNLGE
jgi:3-oxo-5-alpha-steroid 4-dehydrogenase 1